jgi:hypothetical protein
LNPRIAVEGEGSVRFYRRSRLKSSRGHVRIEQRSPWMRWAVLGGALLAVVIVAVIVIAQLVRSDEKKTSPGDNRTWLEFAWTSTPVNPNAVRQLGERLKENDITRVYLEAAAWRTDGSLVEGEYAAEFAQSLRDTYPGIKILLWVRMSGDEITQADRRFTSGNSTACSSTGVPCWMAASLIFSWCATCAAASERTVRCCR